MRKFICWLLLACLTGSIFADLSDARGRRRGKIRSVCRGAACRCLLFLALLFGFAGTVKAQCVNSFSFGGSSFGFSSFLASRAFVPSYGVNSVAVNSFAVQPFAFNTVAVPAFSFNAAIAVPVRQRVVVRQPRAIRQVNRIRIR